MARLAANLIGVAGAAFGLTTLAHSGFDVSAPGRAPAVLVQEMPAAKGDRISPAQASGQGSAVTTIEVVGVDRTTIVMKDRSGRVLYESDPLTNTTTVSKDARIPSVTVKQTAKSPTVPRSPDERAVSPRPVTEPSRDAAEKGSRPKVGCSSAVSSLVGAASRRAPTLCVT